jgi:hypothetical protein
MMSGLQALNEARERLFADFPFYARNCLRIRAKSGEVRPFDLNQAQEYIHGRLEDQRAKTGKVRAIILKGRQQGCSTLVEGRFYHRTTMSEGVRAFILTHEDQATQNLFDMVSRYHDNCPEFVCPETGAANAKELIFRKLDSGYKVGTAGTKGVGRSSTIQLFHGSEVAFWPHAETHAAGVLQAVPDEAGTEVILESTANGVGNLFHKMWKEAEAGQSEYIAIFVPWFWQDEYQKTVPVDFSEADEERQYREAYGLTLPQIAWRRAKIKELGDPILFKQEYPATAAEAFQMSGHDSYIKPEAIVRARKNTVEPSGSLVIGFDPSRYGADAGAMAFRRSRKVLKVERRYKLSTMESVGWCKQVIDDEKPVRLFIDVGGLGAGVYDRLIEMGYGHVVRAVNFGGEPFEPPKRDERGEIQGGQPYNRRAEMWKLSNDWLNAPAGVDIPDEDFLQADACGPGYKYNSNQMLLIESKEDMRRRGVPSPDGWDSVALTFAEPFGEPAFDLSSFNPVSEWA